MLFNIRIAAGTLVACEVEAAHARASNNPQRVRFLVGLADRVIDEASTAGRIGELAQIFCDSRTSYALH